MAQAPPTSTYSYVQRRLLYRLSTQPIHRTLFVRQLCTYPCQTCVVTCGMWRPDFFPEDRESGKLARVLPFFFHSFLLFGLLFCLVALSVVERNGEDGAICH